MADPVLGQVEIDIVVPGVPRGADPWQADYEELREAVRRQLAPVDASALRVGDAQEGAKGAMLIPILIALGQAGVFTAVGAAFTSWLRERGDREVVVKGQVEGRPIDLRITAKNVESGDVAAMLAASVGG